MHLKLAYLIALLTIGSQPSEQSPCGKYPEELLVSGSCYSLTKLLGKGKYGSAYLGHHLSNSSLEYVIKVSNFSAHIKDNYLGSSFPTKKKAYETEATVLSLLGRLANHEIAMIPRPQGEQYDEMGIIVQSYIPGRLLSQETDVSVIKSVVPKLDSVIKQLYRDTGKGYIHGDLSPDNIIIKEGTEEPILIDFGLSRKVDEDEFCESKASSMTKMMGFVSNLSHAASKKRRPAMSLDPAGPSLKRKLF
jgi:serine/threonine-protein kinase